MAKNEKKKRLEKKRCKICGSPTRVISKYHVGVCGKCFREIAEKMGFTKY